MTTTKAELRDSGMKAAQLLGIDPRTLVAFGFRLHASGQTTVEVELLVDAATRRRLAELVA